MKATLNYKRKSCRWLVKGVIRRNWCKSIQTNRTKQNKKRFILFLSQTLTCFPLAWYKTTVWFNILFINRGYRWDLIKGFLLHWLTLLWFCSELFPISFKRKKIVVSVHFFWRRLARRWSSITFPFTKRKLSRPFPWQRLLSSATLECLIRWNRYRNRFLLFRHYRLLRLPIILRNPILVLTRLQT